DERRDPKSIIASAKFLKDLIELYKGDLVLGLASYNYGAANVNKLIRQKKTRVFKKLFRNVEETRLFVPKVLSRMYILNNIEEYDLSVGKKSLYSGVRKISKKYVTQKNETIDSLIKKYPTDKVAVKHLNPALTSNKIPKGVEIYVEDLNPRYKKMGYY
ncbi:MAG: transglycosylase SLT domain-containing protein, partial [Nanoarchaeota archaeon]|nr:transglycosylase SLT domain-containing protein [Nanoarchaeota archaeon]